MTHLHRLRVYYEDTDLAGIVYYANYFKFIERARTEFIRSLGIDQTNLRKTHGIVFAVRSLRADFALPARFDDQLSIATSVSEVTGARIVLRQNILRDDRLLFSSSVVLACVTDAGRPVRIPLEISGKLAKAAD